MEPLQLLLSLVEHLGRMSFCGGCPTLGFCSREGATGLETAGVGAEQDATTAVGGAEVEFE